MTVVVHTVAITAICVGLVACGSGATPGAATLPDREPDAVGTLSNAWIAGSRGPVSIDEDGVVWGLASDDESWDGAELSIKRAPVQLVDNGAPTVFFDGQGREIPDPSDELWEGQAVRVWCDLMLDSLPSICSVSHLELSHSLEG